MYDTIHKIEDFKRIIEHKLVKSNLRVVIEEKTIGEMLTQVSVILTIPKNKNDILRCYVIKPIFNTYFYRDKNYEEHKKYKEIIKKAYDKIKEHFGEVTEGYWE